MTGREKTDAPDGVGQPLFATTHWGIVLTAANQKTSKAAVALEQLCRAYWYPLYAYVRRRGYGHEDAEDFTQGFLAQLLERDLLAKVDPAKGRFRSFLLGGMNYFLADEASRHQAKKRGGGQSLVFLDAQSAEERYPLEPVESLDAEKLFERRWALTLLERCWNDWNPNTDRREERTFLRIFGIPCSGSEARGISKSRWHSECEKERLK